MIVYPFDRGIRAEEFNILEGIISNLSKIKIGRFKINLK